MSGIVSAVNLSTTVNLSDRSSMIFGLHRAMAGFPDRISICIHGSNVLQKTTLDRRPSLASICGIKTIMASINFVVKRRIFEAKQTAEDARVQSVKAKIRDEVALLAELDQRLTMLINPQNSDEQERRKMIEERRKLVVEYLGKLADTHETQYRAACEAWVEGEGVWGLKRTEGQKALQYLDAYDLIRGRLHELDFLLLERSRYEEQMKFGGRVAAL